MDPQKQAEQGFWWDELNESLPHVYDPDLTPEACAEREAFWAKQKKQELRETNRLLREHVRRIQSGDNSREHRPINQDKVWSGYRKKAEEADPFESLAMINRWITEALPVKFVLESQSDGRLESRLDERAEALKAKRLQLVTIAYPKRSALHAKYLDGVSRTVRDVYFVPDGHTPGEALDRRQVVRSFDTFVTHQQIHLLTD